MDKAADLNLNFDLQVASPFKLLFDNASPEMKLCMSAGIPITSSTEVIDGKTIFKLTTVDEVAIDWHSPNGPCVYVREKGGRLL